MDRLSYGLNEMTRNQKSKLDDYQFRVESVQKLHRT